MKIFSVTILIERNGRKFGCLSVSEFRICSEARFRIVEKMLLSNEELRFPVISLISLHDSILSIPLGRDPLSPPDEIYHLIFSDSVKNASCPDHILL